MGHGKMTEYINRMDKWIREGQGRKTRRALTLFARSKSLPREMLADCAWLAWRSNLPMLGVRLLHSIVRPGPRRPKRATVRERAEYAVCLIYLGAEDEALGILKKLVSSEHPEVYLYKAFAHFSRWDYRKATPLLKKYLSSERLTTYQRLVGNANLAASLVYQREYVEAEAILEQLSRDTLQEEALFLRGIVLELMAILYVGQKRFEEAEKFLTAAEAVLTDSQSPWQLFIRKWRAVIQFQSNPSSTAAMGQLKRVRKEAEEKGNWETVRQCDEYLAVGKEDTRRLIHLYFGTPFRSFREELVRESGGFRVPKTYTWKLGVPVRADNSFDLLSGAPTSSGGLLKPGQLLHRLLSTLASDFYRPFPLATLHYRLYPDEYFNPENSPARVYEAVKRLRQWFKEQEIPLNIEEIGGRYRLRADGPCGIILPEPERRNHKVGANVVERLQRKWPDRPFSLADASRALGVPYRSTHRILEEMRAHGAIARSGKSRATRYFFAS